MTKKLQDEKSKVVSNLLRSNIFFAFGLDLLNYDVILCENSKENFTACTDFQNIYINYKKLIEEKHQNWMPFLLLHEVLHIIFNHDKRLGHRDKFLWQFATDFMINLFIYNLSKESKSAESEIVKIPWDEIKSNCLFEDSFENLLEEEIYEKLLKDGKYKKQEKKQSFKTFLENIGCPIPGDVPECEVEITEIELSYNGKKYKENHVKIPEHVLTKEQREALQERINFSKTMIQNSLLSRGLDSSTFQKYLKRIFNVKINWKILLSDAILTNLEKSPDMEWMSPRLSWLVNPNLPYLPNYSTKEEYGTVVVAVDESGSMSDKDVAKAVDIIHQSKEFFKNIYIIKHDVNIHTKLVEEFTPEVTKDLLKRKHCGGTSHKLVFEEILKYSKTNGNLVSLCIFVTDMCSDINETQNIISSTIPRVYLIPENHQKLNNIIGKIIEVK